MYVRRLWRGLHTAEYKFHWSVRFHIRQYLSEQLQRAIIMYILYYQSVDTSCRRFKLWGVTGEYPTFRSLLPSFFKVLHDTEGTAFLRIPLWKPAISHLLSSHPVPLNLGLCNLSKLVTSTECRTKSHISLANNFFLNVAKCRHLEVTQIKTACINASYRLVQA